MNFLTNKNIVIVAPDQYRDLARRFSHNISKKNGFKAAYFTIKQYNNNDKLIPDTQLAIFIGNKDENELTNDYLPIIQSKSDYNLAGLFYGTDFPKAIIFGEGKLDQVDEFKKLFKKVKNSDVKIDGQNSNLKDTYSFAIALISGGLIGLAAMGIYKLFTKKKKEKILRKLQTELATILFLNNELNKWLNIDDIKAL